MWFLSSVRVEKESHILSKAFNQGEVFPLGHELEPETMGIWMWIVPEKRKVLI